MDDSLLAYRRRITELEQETNRLSHKYQELQGICHFIDDDRQNIRRLAAQWQHFGTYTARLYKSEIELFVLKLKTLEEKFGALMAENSDLKEICLYLDQLHATANGVEVEPSPPSVPASKGLPLHVLCALELNEQLDAGFPRYDETTNVLSLNNQRPPWQGRLHELRSSDPERCIEQLELRVERLEAERLELIKSLSAVQLLSSQALEEDKSTFSLPFLARKADIEHPNDSKPFLGDHSSCSAINPLEKDKMGISFRTPEAIISAVALLDVCSRLDDTEVKTSNHVQDMAETAILKLLLDIAWKKLTEH